METQKEVKIIKIDYICDHCKIGVLSNPSTDGPPTATLTYVCPECHEKNVLKIKYPIITYVNL